MSASQDNNIANKPEDEPDPQATPGRAPAEHAVGAELEELHEVSELVAAASHEPRLMSPGSFRRAKHASPGANAHRTPVFERESLLCICVFMYLYRCSLLCHKILLHISVDVGGRRFCVYVKTSSDWQ